jgi:hypothetical protein
MPDTSPERLPFEPRKKQRPKPEVSATSGANAPSKPAQGSTPKKSSSPKSPTSAQGKSSKQKPEKSSGKSESDRVASQNRQDLAIPEVVSSRMIRRMALLSGVPILLGVMTFVGSYYIVINDIFELPNTAVLLVSMGWFGLGVLGLSYGVISASWEEETSGSLVGWSEFTINFQRLVGAWQEARQKSLK